MRPNAERRMLNAKSQKLKKINSVISGAMKWSEKSPTAGCDEFKVLNRARFLTSFEMTKGFDGSNSAGSKLLNRGGFNG